MYPVLVACTSPCCYVCLNNKETVAKVMITPTYYIALAISY